MADARKRIEAGSLDELARLTALSMRRAYETQHEFINALHAIGLDNARVAELVGTTQATVRSAIAKG